MGPYAGHDKINDGWNLATRPTLDEQIKIKESMLKQSKEMLKRDEEDLKALKEQKRLADLDAENKRLKSELADARSRIEILKGEKDRLRSVNLNKYYEGYNRGVLDGQLDSEYLY